MGRQKKEKKETGRLCRKVDRGKRIMMLCVSTIKCNSRHLLQYILPLQKDPCRRLIIDMTASTWARFHNILHRIWFA